MLNALKAQQATVWAYRYDWANEPAPFNDIFGAAPGVAAWFPGFWPLMLVLFSSLVATAFGNLAWNYAIVKIGVSRVSLWFYWVPVFGVGFAAAQASSTGERRNVACGNSATLPL